jgi:uncharacterized protein YodC (DUF2158 family)
MTVTEVSKKGMISAWFSPVSAPSVMQSTVNKQAHKLTLVFWFVVSAVYQLEK